jgi:hypothetical protein
MHHSLISLPSHRHHPSKDIFNASGLPRDELLRDHFKAEGEPRVEVERSVMVFSFQKTGANPRLNDAVLNTTLFLPSLAQAASVRQRPSKSLAWFQTFCAKRSAWPACARGSSPAGHGSSVYDVRSHLPNLPSPTCSTCPPPLSLSATFTASSTTS